MNKIFIVEDDSVIAEAVATHLENWQMQVACAQDFQKIIEEFQELEPDLVLLDIKLPFNNGFYWCTQIRKISQVPIIFLSSADDSMNIVMAMNMGGDDFISKPFDLNVLTAKIQAMLRRSYGQMLEHHILACQGVELDLDDMSAICNGEKIELSKNEFLILKTLFEKAGKVVSREEIMERLWGNDEFVDDNTLTVNINRIRKKFEGRGRAHLIGTKRGIGYIVEK